MGPAQYLPADFSGVASIKQGGRVLLEKAFGYADMPNQRPNRLDTKFVTASAGKVFTATGILKLVEAGRLSLDSAIGELLDLEWKQIDPGITVRQLLSHTSGIPDYCDEAVVPNYSDIFIDYPCYRIRTSRDMIPLFIDMPMQYAPGARMRYNNTGFVVLGLIIEALSGLPFDEYLAQEVFAPCGMESTGYFEYDRLPANCANAYIRDEARGGWFTNIYSSTAKGVGDGGAFTTVGDVERFWRGLYGGKVLSAGMAGQMTAPQCAEGCYGFGLWMEKLDGHFIPHFEGSEPGVSFLSTYDRQKDLLVTMISNRGDPIWGTSRRLLAEFYSDVPPQFYYGS